ncbi:type III secretion system stator protein SctL [Sodalis sp. dw_96]|uniref:type III secretion system stator protein SctL n=1 Tax=Sodalis sp. dw_96 TaxID=2719794 RepID=UPI001BD25C10|nr:type III secretion system stator protein SctL [Sodalis sp. dw_96]
MWQVKKIALFDPAAAGALLRAETVARQQQALTLAQRAERRGEGTLAQARRQAETILAEAREQAQRQISEQTRSCEHTFWQQADTLFDDWLQQQQRDEAQLVTLAERLLSQALNLVLAGFTPEQRLSALLQQLLREQSRDEQATLYCPETLRGEIEVWLAHHPHLVWQLKTDDRQEAESLTLTTEHGELNINWHTLVQRLSPAPQTPQHTEEKP